MCNRIIGHKMFDHIVLAIIFLNCITIAMERPRIEPASAVSQRLPPHTHTHTHTLRRSINYTISYVGECVVVPAFLRQAENLWSDPSRQ